MTVPREYTVHVLLNITLMVACMLRASSPSVATSVMYLEKK